MSQTLVCKKQKWVWLMRWVLYTSMVLCNVWSLSLNCRKNSTLTVTGQGGLYLRQAGNRCSKRVSWLSSHLDLLLQVLADFPSATGNVPFPYLFDLIPVLQPRAFSIASSMQVNLWVWSSHCQLLHSNGGLIVLVLQAHAGQIQILMAVVQYRTKLYRPRRVSHH